MFCDGESLGMGAEIGISTDKFHARGPMGLEELTSYKFVVRGDGLIEAAARYITIDTHEVGIPKGLGTRHSSVAAITMVTGAIGIVVSQSGGKISIFRNGRMVQEIA